MVDRTIFPPDWYRETIYPHYKEIWKLLVDADIPFISVNRLEAYGQAHAISRKFAATDGQIPTILVRTIPRNVKAAAATMVWTRSSPKSVLKPRSNSRYLSAALRGRRVLNVDRNASAGNSSWA